MGQCDIVLTHVPNFDGNGRDLDIHIRTTIRHDYSFIESAAVKVGQDILEVTGFGAYVVNGVAGALGVNHSGVPDLGGYPIFHTPVNKKKHTFDIVLGPQENITISTFKDIVAVSIDAGKESQHYFQDTVGLMGTYNGSLLARDGVAVMEDMNALGQEWQVTDKDPKLFVVDRAPQYPTKCMMPSPRKTEQRRLGETIARRAAEQACSHVSGQKFENCVMDVLAIGDLEIAESYD